MAMYKCTCSVLGVNANCPIHGAGDVEFIKPLTDKIITDYTTRAEKENLARAIPRMPVLAEREKTHGNYIEVAEHIQLFKAQLRASERLCPSYVSESLDMIAVKIARIICGDYRNKDHWKDIQGYAELVIEQIQKEK